MGTQVIPQAPSPLNFDSLRNEWQEFIYESVDIVKANDRLDVTYQFNIPGLTRFSPTLSFPIARANAERILDQQAKEMLFQIGLMELISYWKTTCSPKVKILAGHLSPEQISFWKSLYFNGLGEFFYRNEIETDIESFMTIDVKEDTQKLDIKAEKEQSKAMLVPVGGGKDSATTLAILQEKQDLIYGFAINPIKAAIDTLDVAGIAKERRLYVYRSLDKNMLELNKRGYWNGHTPFSALVAFISTYVAYIHDLGYVVLSNEASANEATVEGTLINHQYSKTSDFEEAFQDYFASYCSKDVFYFSLLRPWSELAIAREFSKHKDYFPIFRSCNVGSKENRWCGHCSKCLFVAIILSPFLSLDQIKEILGQDIYNDLSLEEELEGLCGRIALKPWECVGTVSEVNVALSLTMNRLNANEEEIPKLFKRYERFVSDGEIPGVNIEDGRINSHMDDQFIFHERHSVPHEFLDLLEVMR